MSDSDLETDSDIDEKQKNPDDINWRDMENIRVICRFRPVNSREKREEKQNGLTDIPIELSNNNTTIKLKKPDSLNTKPMEFNLDKFLPSNVTQQQVFLQVSKPMVEACLEGFNTTIFAYGQTGSGKTYTMFGPEKLKSPNEFGCVQRGIAYLFEQIKLRMNDEKATLKTCTTKLYFIQLYREQLHDLLEPESGVPLKIRFDPNTNAPYVPNLKMVEVETIEDVLKMLKIAQKNRVVSKTLMNAVSSRSHMIMTMLIEQNMKDGTLKKSKLNFADLAGSESFEKALGGGSVKDIDPVKLKELRTINLSLTNLTTCINYLSQGRNPSYRSSQLTFLLQDSLGGNAKTTLITAASPHVFNRTETIRTLRFAKTAKAVKNKAKINKELTKAQLMNLVKKLKKENKKLKLRISILESELTKNDIEIPEDSKKSKKKKKSAKSQASSMGFHKPTKSTINVLKSVGVIEDNENDDDTKNTSSPKSPNSSSSKLDTIKENPTTNNNTINTNDNQLSIRVNGKLMCVEPKKQIDKEKYDELQNELKNLQKELTNYEDELNELNDQLRLKNENCTKLEEELFENEKIKKEYLQLKSIKNDMDKKFNKLKNENDININKFKKERIKFDKEKSKLKMDVLKQKDEIQILNTKIDNIEFQKKELHEDNLLLKSQLNELTKQHNAKQEIVDKQLNKLDESERITDRAGKLLCKYFLNNNNTNLSDNIINKTDDSLDKLNNNIIKTRKEYESFPLLKKSLLINNKNDDIKENDSLSSSINTQNIQTTTSKENLIKQMNILIKYLKVSMKRMKEIKQNNEEEISNIKEEKNVVIDRLKEENESMKMYQNQVELKDKKIKELEDEIETLKINMLTNEVSTEDRENSNGDQSDAIDDEYQLSDQIKFLQDVGAMKYGNSNINPCYDENLISGLNSINQPHSAQQIAIWRQQITIGSKVDCLDETCVWWTSKVIDESGTKVKISYDGFSDRWDEWIDRGSTRIAPHLSRAKGGKESHGVAVKLETVAKRKNKQGIEKRVFKQGFLTKQGGILKNFKTRYFVLMEDGTLEYFKKMTDTKPLGAFNVKSMIETRVLDHNHNNGFYGFDLVTPKRTWRFQADNEPIINDWISVIHAVSQGMQPENEVAVIYEGYDDKFDKNKNENKNIKVNRNPKSIQYEKSSHPPINRADMMLYESKNNQSASSPISNGSGIDLNDNNNNMYLDPKLMKSTSDAMSLPTTNSISNINNNNSNDNINNINNIKSPNDKNNIDHEGYMHMASVFDTNYNKYYCQLLRQPPLLRLFNNKRLAKQVNELDLRQMIQLLDVKKTSDKHQKLEIPTIHAFQIVFPAKGYTFACKSRTDMLMWIRKMRALSDTQNKPRNSTITRKELSKGSNFQKFKKGLGRFLGVSQQHIPVSHVLRKEDVKIKTKQNGTNSIPSNSLVNIPNHQRRGSLNSLHGSTIQPPNSINNNNNNNMSRTRHKSLGPDSISHSLSSLKYINNHNRRQSAPARHVMDDIKRIQWNHNRNGSGSIKSRPEKKINDDDIDSINSSPKNVSKSSVIKSPPPPNGLFDKDANNDSVLKTPKIFDDDGKLSDLSD